jgi:hypothetical protein
MKREFTLDVGEEICWEGRPAPRCYTFRNWRHSFFGLVLMPVCSYWQYSGLDFAVEYDIFWLAWLPLPFLLMALYLTIGHLFQARLEWNHIYYAITDRRLLIQRGLLTRRIDSLELQDITYFSLLPQGEQLGTLQVHKGQEKRLTLYCVEHPRQATDLLEVAMGDKAKTLSPNGD